MNLKKTANGIAIDKLAPGGPAQRSGQLQVDDVIDQVDGRYASGVGLFLYTRSLLHLYLDFAST